MRLISPIVQCSKGFIELVPGLFPSWPRLEWQVQPEVRSTSWRSPASEKNSSVGSDKLDGM